jgi:hypothetical protein
MRAISRRLRRLEDRVAPRPNEEDFRLANILRERLRRLLEAAGEPFDDTPPEISTSARKGPQSLASILRARFERASPSSG